MKRLFLFLAVLFFCGRVLAINEVPVIIILGQSNADGSAGIGSWSPSIEGATLAQRDVSLGFEGFVANNPDYKMKMWHRNVRCNPNGWRNPVVRDAVNLGTPGWKYLSYKTELAKNRSAMSIGSDDWNGSGVDLNQRGIEGGLMLEWGTVKGTKSELYVLKVGVQGSYIGSWTTVADETNWIYFRDKIAKEAFTDLLKQGKTPVLAGVWWMQGESDKGATTEYYQNCLGELINKCATQLGFTAPPFYIGQIAVGTGSYDANIRRAQQNLIDANPNNVFFSVTDGLAMGDPDKVHFTYQSYSTIGKNLADAVIGNSAKWGEFSTKVNRWIKTTQQINHLSDVAIELWNIEPTAVTYEYEVGGTWLPISGVTTVGTYPVRANITVGSYLETITGGTLTVEASSVIYVDGDAVSSGDGKSWASAKKSLSEAITSAPSGGEIWIKGSTNGIQYNNAGQINISSGLSIYGGFAGDETNLVGRDAKKNRVIVKQINTTANATNRVFNITADNVTIDGITITGGKCDGTTNSTGGGAMIVNGQNFHLNNCVVEDNSATAGVGGLMLINSAGAKVENTIFSSNWSGWCGFAANIGTTTVSNCLFYNNGCQWSGATISVMDAAATINVYNSTFIKSVSTNAPSDQACAIYSDKGSINIFNSVLLGNNGCDAWLNSGILTMENCAYENVNNITPTGSITLTSAKAPENFVKPGFTTKATNVYAYSNFKDYDFALKDGAALFNKGNNTNTCGAALDIAGNTRIMYGIVDIGAYEYADVNPKAITGTVTNLGSSTATLNGSYLNITPLTVGFQYKLASEDWASAKFVQASIITTPYSVDITGLIKDADYVVRAVASDDKTTLNGIEVLFKTSLWGVENEITNETELTAFRTWINSGNT
ncbi:MAG: sialate O-acetylesterase, partial [Bacteroidales bacterium]